MEFPAIVERLAGATESARGDELAHGLEPSAELDEVARRQALTAEGIALLDNAAEPTLAGLADVRAAAAHAARDGVLGPGDLHQVAKAIAIGLEARRALGCAGAAAARVGRAGRTVARLARRCDRPLRRRGRLRPPRQRVARTAAAAERAAQRTAACDRGARARRALERADRVPAGTVRHRA